MSARTGTGVAALWAGLNFWYVRDDASCAPRLRNAFCMLLKLLDVKTGVVARIIIDLSSRRRPMPTGMLEAVTDSMQARLYSLPMDRQTDGTAHTPSVRTCQKKSFSAGAHTHPFPRFQRAPTGNHYACHE